MNNETEIGSAGTTDRRGLHGGSSGEQSPLQARAQFLKNRSWDLVVSLNRGACARGGAQHGTNREAYEKIAAEWRGKQGEALSFTETIEFLRHCHRGAPFLFFNGNTFADVARQLATALFGDLPTTRRREAVSAIAHYIAGVLDREAMVEIVESLCRTAQLKPDDRVKTFRGTTHGSILRILPDGRVVWRPDGSSAELMALPETLLPEK